MSDDIVERLRALSEVTTEWRHIALHYDAADEIERLRARVAVLESDRRERIATACLSALLTHVAWERMSDVRNAVVYADELIAELDRGAQP
jgi:tRNA(His) 5'-end guanylyltransferase